MNKKVILISIDGMRPDGALQCGNPFVEEMLKLGACTLEARTVFPSVTLPCHMSMFHSVPPERHNVTTNTYVPPIHAFNGLFEQLKAAGKVCAMFYGWEPMRDVARPGCLTYASYFNVYASDHSDAVQTRNALDCIEKFHPDFVFLYMPELDDKGGHDKGWMTPTYLEVLHDAIENVKTVWEAVRDEYTVIVTADHGGHDRGHGSDLPEDMTIPMFCLGEPFVPGSKLENAGILDVTPTIAALMGVSSVREWEGKSLI